MTNSDITETSLKFSGYLQIITFPPKGEVLGVDRNGYGVTKWAIKSSKDHFAKNKNGTVTVVGIFPIQLEFGYLYNLIVKEKDDPTYGKQYSLIYISENVDFSVEGNLTSFLTLLTSEDICQRLLKVYPNVLEILDKGDTDALEKVKGIGPYISRSIIQKYQEKKDLSALYIELDKYGFTENMIQKLINSFRDPVSIIKTITYHPYDLIKKVPGIGFIRADEIALKSGFSLKSIERVKAFIIYILETYADHGDSFMYSQELIEEIYNNIGPKEDVLEIIKDDEGKIVDTNISKAIDELIADDTIILEEANSRKYRRIYLKYYYELEKNIAFHLKRLLDAPDTFEYDGWRKKIREKEEEQGWEFTEEQRKGIELALKNQVCLITGSAGTGKSSLVGGVLSILGKYDFAQVALAGKAAARLQEITGSLGSTIHRLLGYQDGGFLKGELNPLEQRIIILDEISLIGGEIFLSLLKAIPTGAKLILLGDLGQLESVGSLCIARDLFISPLIPTIELKTIHRQAQKSGIIISATKTRHQDMLFAYDFVGKETVGELMDMHYNISLEKNDFPQKIADIYKEYYNSPLVHKDVMNLQALSPTRERGDSSVFNLNNIIQKEINPYIKNESQIEVSYNSNLKFFIRENDKVMCIKNNYHSSVFSSESIIEGKDIQENMEDENSKERCDFEEGIIFNGWTGIVKKVSSEGVYINFPLYEGKINSKDAWIFIKNKELKENIVLAYACTVHKYQGSGSPVIIGVIDNSVPPMMRTKELLYTMLTRAEKECTLVAQNSAVQSCIRNSFVSTKRTFLQEFFKDTSWYEQYYKDHEAELKARKKLIKEFSPNEIKMQEG